MKKLGLSIILITVLLALSTFAFAGEGQGKAKEKDKAGSGAGKDKKAGKNAAQQKGKPDGKGLDHAGTVANPQGVEHGISNAQGKQDGHEPAKTKGRRKGAKGKKAAKGKSKN